MSKIPSAEKRNRQRIRRRQRNLTHLSRVRTYVKRVQAAVEGGQTDAKVVELLKEAVRLIDKAAQKGVLKRETAARKISRLTKSVSAASSS